MFPVGAIMSNNTTSLSEEASCVSSFGTLNPLASNISPVDQQPQNIKKKRNLPGNPDPDAEVIALSPRTLLATNRFMCEICKKGFQRDQNLQLHRRGHNLPWKLKQRNNNKDVIKKKAYVCPEASCVHHHPSRALGDLTGIKKHFCRKHGEKKWKCEKCAKIYAVQSDWKAHSRTCGTREYRCDCGTLFSRKDSFVTHRAFCDALAEESARLSAATNAVPILMSSSSTATPPQPLSLQQQQQQHHHQPIFSLLNQHQQEEQKHDYFQNPPIHISLNTWDPPPPQNPNPNPAILHHNNHIINIKPEAISNNIDLPISNSPFLFYQEPPPPSSSYKNFLMMTSPFHSPPPPASSAAAHLLSATALLQKAATAGAQPAGHVPSAMSRMDLGCLGHVTAGIPPDYQMGNFATWQQRSDHNRGPTRDFLGVGV